MAAKPRHMKSERQTHLLLILALVALNVLVKWTLWTQPPQTFPDSLGYIAPAMRLLDGLGYGSQDNGYRTPTYPLFIAAIVWPFPHAELSECREARSPACLGEAQHTPGGEVDLRAVTIVQVALGILTILLVYGFVWQVSRNVWIAALCTLTYPIDLSTGYWEISLLTDTLTTFLLALAVFLTVLAGERGMEHNAERGGQRGGERNPAEERGTGPAEERGTGPAEERGTGPAEERGTGPAEERGTGPAGERGTGPAEERGTRSGERSLRWWGLHVALGLTLGALALCHSVYVLYALVPAAFLWWRRRASLSITPCPLFPNGEEGVREIGIWRDTPDSPRQGALPPEPPTHRRGQYASTVVKERGNLLLFPKGKGIGFLAQGVALVVLIPALLLIAWSARNYRVDGYFTPSTIAGYNLTQMVGPFMEQSPAPYRDLAEIYLDYRSDRIAERGNHSGTIFLAYRDMLNVRQTTWAGLSRMLTDMSVQMIAHNPRGYLQVAWQSFRQFWKFGLGRQNSELPLSWDWVKWFLDTRVHQAWMVLFFLSPLGLVLVQFSRRVEMPRAIWIWFAIATVLYAALFSSAFNFGDNERYRTHVARLQYSAVILAAWYVGRSFLAWRHRTGDVAEAVHHGV